MRARLGIVTLLLALFATQAVAQAPRPEPGCGGVSAKDGAGDQSGLTVTPGENADIKSLFFLTEGTKTTANIVVKNLTTDVPTGATDLNWYVQWTAGEDIKFVKAGVDSKGNVTYGYGTLVTNIYQEEGETSGKLYTGADGVISIAIPANIVTAKKISEPSTSSHSAQNIPMVGGRLEEHDAAPDSGAGKDFSTVPCESSTPVPPLTLTTKSASSKKVKKTIAVKLSAAEAVTDLTGTMSKGSKIVASGRLAQLSGAGTIKLKVKGKGKLKTGSYNLQLTGTTAGGAFTQGFKFKIKK